MVASRRRGFSVRSIAPSPGRATIAVVGSPLPARYRPAASTVSQAGAILNGKGILDASTDHRVNAWRFRAVTGLPPMATSEQLLAPLGKEKASLGVSMVPQTS